MGPVQREVLCGCRFAACPMTMLMINVTGDCESRRQLDSQGLSGKWLLKHGAL